MVPVAPSASYRSSAFSLGSETPIRCGVYVASKHSVALGISGGFAASVAGLPIACHTSRQCITSPWGLEPARSSNAGGGSGQRAPLVVISGPPAAGKGTQCKRIQAQYGYVHISTGDILRENVRNETELGLKVKSYMDMGTLVPSDLILDLVCDRLTWPDVREKGCLLDGFPRTPDQAQAMAAAGLRVECFLLITVPDDTIVERGCGRRIDPETGNIYHMKFRPPPMEIASRLVHRTDDREDKIRARLETHHSQISRILPLFEDVLIEVDGTGQPDDVFKLISSPRGSHCAPFRANCAMSVGAYAQLAHKLLTFPQGSTQGFCNVIKIGTFCRCVVWPVLPPLMMYQYIRAKDEDAYTTEVLYYKSGSHDFKAFNDTSRVGISGHWRIQQDMETIRAAANAE